MIHRAGIWCIALVLLASPALGEEADAGTRFHDAYVLEVIDGQIAEAAKAYFALVGDERVVMRIRDEARFRFAICTVLLGRPDEGRMHLAAIVENERTPANLRKRAEAYLESISALGIGTELERKLNALVFDLGRANPRTLAIPAYRDFEIIGKPAIPFLERLLQHEDVNLRRHAFRLLIRLGAKDLVARWTPQIDFVGQGFSEDFVFRYLDENPDELPRLEAKLLALDDDTLHGLLTTIPPYPEWSLEFVRALTQREKLLRYAFSFLARAGTRAEQWALARACILGNDAAQRDMACDWALGQKDGPPDELVEALWPVFARRMAATGHPWRSSATLSSNLRSWATRVSTPLILALLEEVIGVWRTPPTAEERRRLSAGPAVVIASALADRDLTAEELDRYDALIRRWVDVIAPTLEGEMGYRDVNPVAKPLRNLVERLPAEPAAALVRWLFEGPAHERAWWFEDMVRIERPGDVPLLVEAVRRVHPDQRGVLLHLVPKVNAGWPSVEIARAVVDALPTLLRLSTVEAVNDHRPGRRGFWGQLYQLTGRVPDEDLAMSMRRLFETAADMDEKEPQALFDRLVSFSAQTGVVMGKKGAFFARFVLPAVDAQHERLTESFRRHAMQQTLHPLRYRYGLAQRDWAEIARYVLRHQGDLQPNELSVLVAHPDLFPLEAWLPGAPLSDVFSATHRLPWKDGQVDEAMKILTTDVTKIDDAVLYVLVGRASTELARGVIDRMLASGDAAIRHRAIEVLRDRNGYPASPEGLETALAALLGEEDGDPKDLARIAVLLSTIQPSERLLPAAERMLASDDASVQLQGVLLAKRLGREELVPSLARLLTSLDATLRDKAQAAIHAIQELKRLQEEAGGER